VVPPAVAPPSFFDFPSVDVPLFSTRPRWWLPAATLVLLAYTRPRAGGGTREARRLLHAKEATATRGGLEKAGRRGRGWRAGSDAVPD